MSEENKQSTLYKLLFNLNLVADMKLTFNMLYNEVAQQLGKLSDEEREKFKELVKPEYILDDLENGLGEFWAESAESYKPVDLEKLYKWD